MDHEIQELDRKELRKFAFTVGPAIAIIFGLALPYLFDLEFRKWPWVVAAILVLWGVVAPATLQPVYKGWMKFALLINKVTSPLVLGIVFVVLILPIGLLFRLFGRDLMYRRFEPADDSYKHVVDKDSFDDLTRPF